MAENLPERPPDKGLTVPKNPAMALRQLNTRHGSSELPETVSTPETNLLQNKPTTKQTNNTTNPPAEKNGSDMGMVDADRDADGGPDTGQGTGTPLAVLGQPDPIPKHRIPQENKKTNLLQNKPTTKQTNNTTNFPVRQEQEAPLPRRDGRTLRNRQAVSDPAATIVTSFRLPAALMETLDEFCFQHRLRKQDVLQQALEAFFNAAEDDGE